MSWTTTFLLRKVESMKSVNFDSEVINLIFECFKFELLKVLQVKTDEAQSKLCVMQLNSSLKRSCLITTPFMRNFLVFILI